MNGATTGVWIGLAVMAIGQLAELLGVHLTDAQTQQTATAIVSLLAGAAAAAAHHLHPGVKRPKEGGFLRLGALPLLAAAGAGLLLLAGCSTMGDLAATAHYNPANYQGCTAVVYEPPGGTTAPGDAAPSGGPSRIAWIDCKDKASVHAQLNLATNTLDYQAQGITGEQQAAARQATEQLFSQHAAEVTPSVAEALMKVIIGVFAPPAAATSALSTGLGAAGRAAAGAGGVPVPVIPGIAPGGS